MSEKQASGFLFALAACVLIGIILIIFNSQLQEPEIKAEQMTTTETAAGDHGLSWS